MTIFTGGKSTAINSPRHLVLRHARRTVGLQKLTHGLLADNEEVTEPDLKPGEEKLNSYWAPGLEAGPQHCVNVTQIIKPPTSETPLELTAEQDFFVDAPQFSLPEGSVHSIYPPSGYPDDHRILPHVVLTDPHLPWERLGSPKTEEHTDDRNRVPWLALFTFTQDELRLPLETLDGDNSIFKNTSTQLAKPVKQTPTLAVNMTVADLWVTDSIVTPVMANLGPDNTKNSRGDFIFVKPDLFTSLFSPFDKDNERQAPSSPDTSRYKFLAHVRKINTAGMAVAGFEDVGIFSVVVGSRCGPLDNTAPVSVSVHLVSIEGVEAMDFPIIKDYVVLCSLHSWNYTVVPPGMLNVPDALESLGRTLSVLRSPDTVINPLKSAGAVPERLAHRLEDGYSLVKYRTQTGEQTVALFRGPFTPTVVPHLPMNNCSNSGQDLQILDKEVGIMDITFSAAWQLGRTLALGDQGFAAALARLRTAIHKRAMKESKIIAVIDTAWTSASFRTRTDVLRDLSDLPATLRSLTRIHIPRPPGSVDGHRPFKPGGHLKRWHRPRLRRRDFPPLGFTAPKIKDNYLGQAIRAARELAKATDGNIYDETNTPVSTDWMVVLAWVMNRMFLAGVPAHYLITDPSHLEYESLRFFHIDPNWVDAMVDGALSLANHMGDDKDRVAIKTALNDYIKSKPALQPHAPQIPTYGFYLRSDLVTMFPDLKVTTLPEPPKGIRPQRAPLLRHEIVIDGVMLGLLDRLPGSKDFTGLVFTQPPHQQRFAAGRGLDTKRIKIDLRRQYTVNETIREQDPNRHEVLEQIRKSSTDTDNWFIWGNDSGKDDLRILRLPHIADEQLQILNEKMGTYDDHGTWKRYFEDDAATSALLALQLNDPIYNLTILFWTPEVAAALASLRPSDDGTATDAPRTLKRLTHSKVKRFAVHEPESGDEHTPEEPDHDILAERATFERHRSYRPSPYVLAHIAPHVRAAPTEVPEPAVFPEQPGQSSTTALGVQPQPDSSPASAPQFTCSIYTPTFSSVQTGDQLPQDLIFSVLVSNNSNSDYELIEFDIRICLGPVDPDRNMLMAGYDGPGPSMLSNLRFNVLESFPTIDGNSYLQLRLLPRSAKGWINITQVNEMGFLLCLAKVNDFGNHQTLVQVDTLAYYRNDNSSPRKDSFVVNVNNNTVSSS